jgi:phenylpropionate dioxygenase-like ring-hydroxylating dioxygenase large terminal subunit
VTATLPYRWYSDADVLEQERARLFAGTWQYVGHAGELAEPGSYFTCRIGEVPIVVVRDRERALRAFVNVCRHRGAEVVAGAGRCSTLQCHYHAWTYGLDGALRAAPRSGEEPGFDRAKHGLRRAPLETWGPFVFVNPDPDAAPLAATLGELPELLRRGGLDVDALEFHKRAHYSLEANWKVVVENYLECYHCAVAHPGFSDAVDVGADAYRLESHPTFASHHAHARAGVAVTAGEIEGQFHLVWPNLKVNVMPGRPNLSIGPLHPVAPGRTDGFLDYFLAPGEDARWIEEFTVLDDRVGAEDRVLVESVQRGMRSGVFESGRLLLPGEQLIADFQRWVAVGLDGHTPSRGKRSDHVRE